MTKHEFIDALRARLADLPPEEVEERLGFWAEMIDDRMEDGADEEEAVAKMGSLDEVVSQIVSDIPLLTLAKQRIKPKKRLSTGIIVLLAIGAPVWGSILISLLAAVFSVYVSVWATVVSLWSVFAALVGCAVGGLVSGVALAIVQSVPVGLALIAVALVCAGLSVFAFFGCREACRGLLTLTKKTILAIKRALVKKEGVA